MVRTHPPTEERIRRPLALAPPAQVGLPGSPPVWPARHAGGGIAPRPAALSCERIVVLTLEAR